MRQKTKPKEKQKEQQQDKGDVTPMSKTEIEKIIHNFNNTNEGKAMLKKISDCHVKFKNIRGVEDSMDKKEDLQLYARSNGPQLYYLIVRNFKEKWRDPVGFKVQCSQNIMFGLVTGSLYSNLGENQRAYSISMVILLILINNAMAGDDGLLREQISRWRPVTLSALSEVAKLEKKSLRLLTTLTLAEYRSLDPYEQQDVLERCFSEYEKSLHALLGILTKKLGQDEDGKYDEHFDTYRIGLDLPRIKTLSGEAAELLRYYPGSSISLTSLKKISDEAVAALAKYRGHIDLQGVNNLSETALLALANHKDRFHYNGLALGFSRLDDSSAEILAGFKGHTIFLNKLTKISDSAADSLSRYKGDLYLVGLRQLSPAAAHCLASHRGELTLGSRCKLSDEAAVAISFHSNLCR